MDYLEKVAEYEFCGFIWLSCVGSKSQLHSYSLTVFYPLKDHLLARSWRQVCHTLPESFTSQTQQLSIFHSGNFYLPRNFLLSEIRSIYILAYATGPLLVSPLSEIHGRLWILQLSNLTLFIFNLGCAFAPNEAALITFRFLGEYLACYLCFACTKCQ
jgi:MFS family permease